MAAPIGGAPPWMDRPWPPGPSTSTNKMIDGFHEGVEFDYDDGEDPDVGNEYFDLSITCDDDDNMDMGNEYLWA